jgi:CMP/dCMP kinase
MANTGQRFRDFCASLGWSIQQVSELPDQVHRDFDAYQKQMLTDETNIIVEGRLAGWLARDIHDVLRVWCEAPAAVRADRLASREKIDLQRALAEMDHRDRGDLEKYRRVYGIEDYRDAAYYQLHLDTTKNLPIDLAAQVAAYAGFGLLTQV